MKNPEMFWELQCLEVKRLNLLKQMKEMPETLQLRSLKTEIEEIQKNTRGLSEKADSLKKEIKRKESDLAILKEKIEKANAELYGTGSQVSRGLEAAEKNISIIKQKIETEEDITLRLMEELEQYNFEIKELLTILEEKKNSFRETNKTYIEKKQSISRELDEIKTLNEKYTARIDPEHLNYYYQLNKKFPDNTAIALLQNGVCSGCHMALSFYQLKQAKNDISGISCDNCGRLLVFK